MEYFEKILKITGEEKVELRHEIKETIHKELCLGMTRFVCRNGTLSEGFDKFTDAQKYYQAVKETYIRSNELKRIGANAKKAQADYLESKIEWLEAKEPHTKLRCEGKMELAELALFELLVQTEDTWRQFDEFNKVRLELKPIVTAQYPEGIEQAESDNWHAVAQAWAMRKLTGAGTLGHIPLPANDKEKLAQIYKLPELSIAKIVENKPEALT